MSDELEWIDTFKEIAFEHNEPEQSKERISDDSRRRGRDVSDKVYLSIMRDEDGVIRLDTRDEAHVSKSPAGRRASRRRQRPDTLIDEIPLSALPPSDVYKALEKVDLKLTPKASTAAFDQRGSSKPRSGLRQLHAQNRKWIPIDRPTANGKVLLIIHGTFSNNDTTLKHMLGAQDGALFLTQALGHYDQVIGYDHRTLGVSPILNARELALLFEGSQAEIDIVCHSRGGLVARWFVEAFDHNLTRKTRVVFVGAPLAGTGLASPHNVRQTMELFSNIASVFGKGVGAIPFLEIVSLLARITGYLLKGVAKTPIADAAIALVPGLDSMSRIGNNQELLLAQRDLHPSHGKDYFAVVSNFEPEDVTWKFWKAFRNPADRLKDWGADTLFDGANDLVVDTVSMRQLNDTHQISPSNTLDYGTSSTVHHTNYFQQNNFYRKLDTWLL